MPWDRAQVTALLLESSRIALDHYEAPPREIKADGSIVTAADRAIESHLAEALERPNDGVFSIGEETAGERDAAYIRRALDGECYIIDPIDGTAPYAHHVPVWGISIGYARGGVLREGAIFLPITRELFATESDNVYYSCGDPATASPLERRPQEYRPDGLIAVSQALTRGGRLPVPNPVQALACAVVPLTYLLLGRFLAVQTSVKIWDVAAALPMLWRLGLTAAFVDGGGPRPAIGGDWLNLDAASKTCWYLRDDCICGEPGVVEHLRGVLAGA